MLDAACPGEVFTSPVPEQMLAATKAVDGGAGVIHIVKNYTGDVMNFKLAAEDAADEGIDVESVLVDDDVAVQDSLYTAGRRGVGATVLLEKIAGASAERGDDLATVAGDRAARQRARALVRRSRCPRARRRRPASRSSTCPTARSRSASASTASRAGAASRSARPASWLASWSSRCSATSSRRGRACWRSSTAWAARPQLELYLLYHEVDELLRAAGLEPARNLVGSYITSLEMAGASLTLLELDDELESLWDAPVDTAALRWGA